MMNLAPAIVFVLTACAMTGCGDDAPGAGSPAEHDAAREATGVLVVQKRQLGERAAVRHEAFCSGTLIAPDVVLTSATCGEIARSAQVGFTTTPHAHAEPTLVRAATLPTDAPGLPCPDALTAHGADAATVTPRARACDALRMRCGVRGIAMPDARTLACIHAQPEALLREAQFLGFVPGYDLALLFLEQAVDTTPATLADGGVQNVFLRAQAETRALAFAKGAPHDGSAAPATAPDTGPGAATAALKTAPLSHIHLTDSMRPIIETRPNALWARGDAGGDAIDRGGALLLRYDAAHAASPWLLTAVAARPWRYGQGSEAGMIYSRLDDQAVAWLRDQLDNACADGRRADCHLGTSVATGTLANSEGCSLAPPSWGLPVLVLGWLVHRAGRVRRAARARLMYGLLALGCASTLAACGDVPGDTNLRHSAHGLREAMIEGAAANDTHLAVGAIVKPAGQDDSHLSDVACTGTLIAPDVVLTAAHCADETHAFFQVGDVLPKIGFRPGSTASFGGLTATTQVRHIALHPDYWHATLANGGTHHTFCPDGDVLHPDRQAACDSLLATCRVGDYLSLRYYVSGEGDHPSTQADRDRVRKCVDAADEDTLRRAGYIGVFDDHDMALLFLESPVPNARIAPLPSAADVARLTRGRSLVGVGFGERTLDGSGGAAGETRGEKHTIRNSIEELGQWELRLGTKPPQACNADSGGPLFFDGSDKAPIMGVVSRKADMRSRQCNTGVIYGRVDSERRWIEATLEDVCQRGIRFGCRPVAPTPRHAPRPTPDADAMPEHNGCQSAPVTGVLWMVLGAWGVLQMRRRRRHRHRAAA